jgi:hypothetical protein
MNQLSVNILNTEAYSAVFTLHNTMEAGDYGYRSLAIMIYISKKEYLIKIPIIAVIIKWLIDQ